MRVRDQPALALAEHARLPRDPLQHAHRTGRADFAEIAGVQGATVDVERCLAAFCWIRKDVVDDQRATHVDPTGPAVKVSVGGLLGVSSVDEQEPQRCSPTPGHHGRLSDDCHDAIVESGGVQCVAQ